MQIANHASSDNHLQRHSECEIVERCSVWVTAPFSSALPLLLVLLFLPKWNLFAIPGESAGVRIDDLFLLFAAALLYRSYCLHRWPSTRSEQLFFLFVTCGIGSVLLNSLVRAEPPSPRLLYAVRPLEYFLFFYAGRCFAVRQQLLALIVPLLGWHALWLVVQKAGLLGGFFLGEWRSDLSDRAIGIGAFPSEAAALLNILAPCAFWRLHAQRSLAQDVRLIAWLLITLLFAVLVSCTGSRIGLWALVVTSLTYGAPYRASVPLLMLLCVAGVVVFGMSSDGIGWVTWVLGRADVLFSWDNITLIVKSWEKNSLSEPLERLLQGYQSTDESWFVRLFKWLFALQLSANHVWSWVFGLGPGTFGPALDGGLLRVVLEYGAVGVLLLWLFLKPMWSDSMVRAILLALLWNLLFFDLYLAYKTMSLLFLIFGHLHSLGPSERDSRSR